MKCGLRAKNKIYDDYSGINFLGYQELPEIINYIGLKNFGKQYEGCGLRYKVERLYWELRYAFQRAWKGYDFLSVVDCSYRFRELMIFILEEFKEHNIAPFYFPEESEHYEDYKGEIDSFCQRKLMPKEDTDLIIDMMIYHLKLSDHDYVENFIYKNEVKNLKKDDYKRISAIANDNKTRFFKLFSMFFYQIWY